MLIRKFLWAIDWAVLTNFYHSVPGNTGRTYCLSSSFSLSLHSEPHVLGVFIFWSRYKARDTPSDKQDWHWVPDEGNLVQRYFEAEHSATAIIHPKTELAPSTPGRRDGRSTLQSTSNSSRRFPRRLPPHTTRPAQSLGPAYFSIYGQGSPAYPLYYAPSNDGPLPAPFPQGTGMYCGQDPSDGPMYRQRSFPYRYWIK